MKLKQPTEKVKNILCVINAILIMLYITFMVPIENWLVHKVGAAIAITICIVVTFLIIILTVYNMTDGFKDKSTGNSDDYDF